jgi:membrane protein YdbS with pleckstrin-like domain
MEQLHPGAKWLFRIQSYASFLILFIFFVFTLFVDMAKGGISSNLILIIVIILVFCIMLAEIFVRWAYRNWKYEFTQDSLKIEKGVIVKKYKSIPYERIQNVDITRGIIARIIGFSTIDIQTAGYSAYNPHGGAGQSEGHIPAVSMEGAEKIREFLMKKITGKKQGL